MQMVVARVWSFTAVIDAGGSVRRELPILTKAVYPHRKDFRFRRKWERQARVCISMFSYEALLRATSRGSGQGTPSAFPYKLREGRLSYITLAAARSGFPDAAVPPFKTYRFCSAVREQVVKTEPSSHDVAILRQDK